jgi:LEA14-like dessication related protein
MRKNAFLLLCCVGLLSSCAVYKDVEVTEVLDIQVLEFDHEGAECEIFLSIYNPNPYKITLTESHVDLFFDGKSLGEVQLLEKVVIPKKAQSTISMKCEASYENLQAIMGNIITLMFQSEYVLEGNGYIRGKALLVSKDVPVVFKETLTKADLGF